MDKFKKTFKDKLSKSGEPNLVRKSSPLERREYPIPEPVVDQSRQDYSDSGRYADKNTNIDEYLQRVMEEKTRQDNISRDPASIEQMNRGPLQSEIQNEVPEYSLEEDQARFKNLLQRLQK